jgi:copper chaperone CopZ
MHIKQALKELGIENTEVDLAKKIITLETDNLDAVLKKLEDIGYPSKVI